MNTNRTLEYKCEVCGAKDNLVPIESLGRIIGYICRENHKTKPITEEEIAIMDQFKIPLEGARAVLKLIELGFSFEDYEVAWRVFG